MDEFSRFVDGEAVSDMMDELQRVESFDEVEVSGAKPEVEEKMRWAYHCGNILVGQNSPTKESCGKIGVFYGCVNVAGHHDHFDGEGKFVHCEGKVYMRYGKHSCDRYSCKVCYRRVAGRQAVRAEERLAEGSKKFGLAEHIIASVPLRLYYITDGHRLKLLARKIVEKVGVIGGSDVFHGFRYSYAKGWYWSPHIHHLGYILGGYKCRNCPNFDFASHSVCGNCNEFEARVRRMNDRDGWIVKVARDRISGKAEVRKSVRKTLGYELAHASVPVGVRRFRVLTYWGCMSYRKLKVTHKRVKRLCPLCHFELKAFRYNGSDALVLSFMKWGICGEFYDKLVDGKGRTNYVEVPQDRFGRSMGW